MGDAKVGPDPAELIAGAKADAQTVTTLMDYITKLVDMRCSELTVTHTDPTSRRSWEEAYLAFGRVRATMCKTTFAFKCDASTESKWTSSSI